MMLKKNMAGLIFRMPQKIVHKIHDAIQNVKSYELQEAFNTKEQAELIIKIGHNYSNNSIPSLQNTIQTLEWIIDQKTSDAILAQEVLLTIAQMEAHIDKRYYRLPSYNNLKEEIPAEIIRTGIAAKRMLTRIFSRFCGNEEPMLKAIQADWRAIQFASDRLRDNEEFLWQAISTTSDWRILLYASNRLRNDKKFMSQIIQFYPFALEAIGEYLLKDKSFAKEIESYLGDFARKIFRELHQAAAQG